MAVVVNPPQRRLRAAPAWRADGLEISLWLVAATAVALMIASGGLLATSDQDYVYAIGRMAGIVASVLVMNQILLISRVPFIERAFGHDRAAAMHTRMGKVAFILMLVHMAFLLIVSANYDDRSVWSQVREFWSLGWFMVAAQAALGLFTLVVATSLLIVRRRWRYESWHAVHLFVYAAIALAVPHQFIQGATFRTKGVAWWFWLVLYGVVFGSWLVYRVCRPLYLAFRHQFRVAEVTTHADGSTSLVMTDVGLLEMGAQPGQFLLWRFLAPGHWLQAHPYSLSAAPTDGTLRITVSPLGDGSATLAALPVGTRVLAEGPLGIFSPSARARDGTVFVAAGIGITPLRAMLETHTAHDGPCTVIVRASSAEDMPLIDEVRDLTRDRFTLHELYGARGTGWTPLGGPANLSELVTDLPDRDVYICGPVAWADAVEADALAAGCQREAIHRERFGWS